MAKTMLFIYYYKPNGSMSKLCKAEGVVAKYQDDADRMIELELIRGKEALVEVRPRAAGSLDGVSVVPLDASGADWRPACWASERINRYVAGIGDGVAMVDGRYPGRGWAAFKEVMRNAFCSTARLANLIVYVLMHETARPQRIRSELMRFGVLFPGHRMRKAIKTLLESGRIGIEDGGDKYDLMDSERIYRL